MPNENTTIVLYQVKHSGCVYIVPVDQGKEGHFVSQDSRLFVIIRGEDNGNIHIRSLMHGDGKKPALGGVIMERLSHGEYFWGEGIEVVLGAWMRISVKSAGCSE